MSPRLRDAAQAGLVALLVGAISASAIIWLFDKGKSFEWTLAAAAALASGITTYSLWYLAFPRREISARRALWVGPLAVAAAMWLMFVLWGLSQSDNAVRDTSLLAWLGKTMVVGVFFAVKGIQADVDASDAGIENALGIGF